MNRPILIARRSQRGIAATEFAVVSILFLALVFAAIEFSLLMFVYASAVEATRLGARVAAVCSVQDVARVHARMKTILNLLQPANISITYPATGCSTTACNPVTVRIQNLTVASPIPLLPLTFRVPEFATSLPSESLDSTNNTLCH